MSKASQKRGMAAVRAMNAWRVREGLWEWLWRKSGEQQVLVLRVWRTVSWSR